MTQYEDRVERQRLQLEAEKWAKVPKSVHIHRLSSMWYETEESKADLEDGNVTDIQYNSGRIERSRNGELIRTFGKDLKGEELVRAYQRGGI
tara:strand:+ start:759 stop:1034 length:276 start_codon:yes stop_codon:yes gene_type:complete